MTRIAQEEENTSNNDSCIRKSCDVTCEWWWDSVSETVLCLVRLW